jgi:hypothetical protein
VATTTKRVLLWLGLAFIVYTVIVSPHRAADLVRAAFDGVSVAGQSLATFFDSLVR